MTEKGLIVCESNKDHKTIIRDEKEYILLIEEELDYTELYRRLYRNYQKDLLDVNHTLASANWNDEDLLLVQQLFHATGLHSNLMKMHNFWTFIDIMLQVVLKCADISNPCRSWTVYICWTHLITEEFFQQGDRERNLNLPIAPTMDRMKIEKPKIQIGFIQFLVRPLFSLYNQFAKSPLSKKIINKCERNLDNWRARNDTLQRLINTFER